MASFIDARIPVVFGGSAIAGAEDALLVEGDDFTVSAPSGHSPGCACCLPRNAAGRALGRLVLARARGEMPFFRRVVVAVVSAQGEADMRAALATDPVASGCFRPVS